MPLSERPARSMPRHGEAAMCRVPSVAKISSIAPFLQREGGCILDEYYGVDCHS